MAKQALEIVSYGIDRKVLSSNIVLYGRTECCHPCFVFFDQMCHVQSACPSFVAVGGREGTVSSRLIGTRGEGNMAGVRPKTGSDFFYFAPSVQ